MVSASRNSIILMQICTGQYEEAIKCFHNALMINKDLAKMHTNKGLEAFRQKKYTEAVYHYDKALDVDPGVSEVLLHKGTNFNCSYIISALLIDEYRRCFVGEDARQRGCNGILLCF
jgi:tetratricopeptide (TPR) repeat protein